jgi:hypothetical protein
MLYRLFLPGLFVVCHCGFALGAELADIVAKVEKSVVQVNTDEGLGSGVVVGEGMVLTNFHVVEGAREVTVKLRSGKEYLSQGFLVAQPTFDMAVLRVADVDKSLALELAESMPRVGERVAALGNPKGFSFTTTEGIISAIRKGREVEQIIGTLEYQILGFATSLTWLQSTAAITGGNSGGPLVNMEGRLVGLNTWHRTEDQHLNFALSLNDIREVLGQVKPGMPPKAFATLPKNPRLPTIAGSPPSLPPGMVPPPIRARDFQLKLPTGRVFTLGVFMTSREAVRQSERNNKTAVIRHPNGAMFATAQHASGVLDGLTLAQYDNQSPMVEASYDNGRRHGNVKVFDEGGEPVLLGQFFQGRKHGFLCLFDDGDLVLIGQYKQDQIEYLQLMSNLKPLKGFASEKEAAQNPEAAARLEALETSERNLTKNEAAFRRQVKLMEDAQRREIAAKLGPEKRARMGERERARDAAENAFIQEMRRRTHGF